MATGQRPKKSKLTVDPIIQGAMSLAHFPQSQSLPQVHSLPLFIAQFLPVFLQFGLSAAKAVAQRTATRIENRVLVYLIIS